jgi:flagellar hook-associated protein 3 FlgL
MRTSTLGSHYSLVNQMLRQQSTMAKTQLQVSSGKRVNTPSDDPVAAGRILALESQLAASSQFERNSGVVQTRLSIEEQALADGGKLLQRVRDLALAANNGSLDDDSRAAIATELDQRINELQAIANRRDAAGEYLFAGNSAGTQPFIRTAAGITYAGDQATREVQVSPTQFVKVGHGGDAVFMGPADGGFTVDTGAANTGTGWIAPLAVSNPSAWTGGSHTVRFIDASNYEILDSTNTQVATGAYASGNSIDFNGVRFAITGAPAPNDSFSIAPAGRQDLFATLDALAATLRQSTATDADRARFNTDISMAISRIDAGMDHLINVRSEVGARLNVLDNVTASRENLDLELQTAVSGLRDVDMAEALSRLTLEKTALSAAQKSFAQMSRMSLFDYL